MLTRSKSRTDTTARVERATARINNLVGCTTLQLALAVGQAVVEELYGGDLDSWRRRGTKEHSLRRLAMDPSLTISASALFRALGIYELKVRVPDHPMWDELSACHIRAVLGLPAPEQDRLLELAAEQQWTTSAIEQAAAMSRNRYKSSRGGRPRKPRFARSIEHAEKVLLDEDEAFGDLDALDDMTPERRADLGRRLHLVRQRCDELASLLDARV
ncbi:hypothetical protein [Enhygromyxa salina]|uniref:Uncharacterized protein n=1 Tax=Enhygromyxa salina TaxID=215803 RepID=A0A2S9YUA4_9BACT|nr:hypothetical protein [Enhygromyxa salina]PRQ08668.1 hypothetical protein ENSA7_16130 [Enhygromyxa salina]